MMFRVLLYLIENGNLRKMAEDLISDACIYNPFIGDQKKTGVFIVLLYYLFKLRNHA